MGGTAVEKSALCPPQLHAAQVCRRGLAGAEQKCTTLDSSPAVTPIIIET